MQWSDLAPPCEWIDLAPPAPKWPKLQRSPQRPTQVVHEKKVETPHGQHVNLTMERVHYNITDLVTESVTCISISFPLLP